MARYLITSALPYINGVKHLGNLAGSMLPADVHARFRRMHGDDVLFICGTDEHGTPAELAAAEAHVTPKTYCDRMFEVQKTLYEKYHLSFDWFGRSSEPENALLTQQVCEELERNGFVESRTTVQLYSPTDGRFLPDRYVEGQCPNCGYQHARGDQCDGCSSLLDPLMLINPRSRISGATELEVRSTEHLYLLLSKLQPDLRSWISSRSNLGPLAQSIAWKWLEEGLKDRPITRDLSWGVPVLKNGAVRPGFERKVFYVWFDAPIAYIAATVRWSQATGRDWRSWWRLDAGADNVTYIQFMGQDNVAFHTVSFPASMIGTRQPWKLVDQIKAVHWVNWSGKKFSTSQGRGLFMDQALELRPADYWRWCLMANAPESSDVSFEWDAFRKAVNSDLANVLGNFFNRVLKFTMMRFNGRVPPLGELTSLELAVVGDLARRLRLLTDLHDRIELRKAASETRAIWASGNEYLQIAKPWELLSRDEQAASRCISFALRLCALFALITSPFLPHFSHKTLRLLGVRVSRWPNDFTQDWLTGLLASGTTVGSIDDLFAKVTDAEMEQWQRRFPS